MHGTVRSEVPTRAEAPPHLDHRSGFTPTQQPPITHAENLLV